MSHQPNKLPTIVIDTREQKPLTFGDRPTTSKKLDVGDYSLRGFEGTLAVERKSMGDLFSTMSVRANRQRFKAELDRARNGFMALYIVVECSVGDLFDRPQRTAISPFRMLESLIRMAAETGANVMFAGSRGEAEILVAAVLKGHYDALKGGEL